MSIIKRTKEVLRALTVSSSKWYRCKIAEYDNKMEWTMNKRYEFILLILDLDSPCVNRTELRRKHKYQWMKQQKKNTHNKSNHFSSFQTSQVYFMCETIETTTVHSSVGSKMKKKRTTENEEKKTVMIPGSAHSFWRRKKITWSSYFDFDCRRYLAFVQWWFQHNLHTRWTWK